MSEMENPKMSEIDDPKMSEIDEEMIGDGEGEQMTMITSSSESAFDCDSISSAGSCSSHSESPAPSGSSGTFVNPNDVGATSSTGPSSSGSQSQPAFMSSPSLRKNSLSQFRQRNDLDDDLDMDSDGENPLPPLPTKRRILQPSSSRRRYSDASFIASNHPCSSNSLLIGNGVPSPQCPGSPNPSGSASPQQPNAPSTPSIYRTLPRGRVANIRREFNCNAALENEVAHERLVKTSQQVSVGFEDFSLDDRCAEERKRTRSLTEPISIFTNAFLTHSSSPSPNQKVDNQKQCYSPSTQQVVRSNIPYSPSPSPTPSPTRHRLMRSQSPIAVRQLTKRRYTSSNVSTANSILASSAPSDSDSESVASSNGFGPVPFKRFCNSPLFERPSCSTTPVRGGTPFSDTASDRHIPEVPEALEELPEPDPRNDPV